MKKISKLTRTLFSAVCCATLAFSSVSSISVYASRTTEVASFSDINITINGVEYNMHPAIINGVSYFPVRTIGYALNCKTDWISETKTIILKSQTEKLSDESFIQQSNKQTAIFDTDISLIADGKTVNTPIAIINDRSYVPVKAVAEAMGKRATWYEESRTIQIVNPQTADNTSEYYVSDLPQIQSEEDYLVGNWKGMLYFGSGQAHIEEIHISKNNDGSYKLITKGIVQGSESTFTVYESKAYYDKESHILKASFVREIDGNMGGIDHDNYYELKDEILRYHSGDSTVTGGSLERF